MLPPSVLVTTTVAERGVARPSSMGPRAAAPLAGVLDVYEHGALVRVVTTPVTSHALTPVRKRLISGVPWASST